MGVQTIREYFYTVSFLVLGKIYGDVEKSKEWVSAEGTHKRRSPKKEIIIFS